MTHFYLVWNPAGPYGGHPTVRHDTLDSARREAERLASLNPGQEFHVLLSVGTARNVAVQYVEHDRLPF